MILAANGQERCHPNDMERFAGRTLCLQGKWRPPLSPLGFGSLPDATCRKARPVGEAAATPSLTKRGHLISRDEPCEGTPTPYSNNILPNSTTITIINISPTSSQKK